MSQMTPGPVPAGPALTPNLGGQSPEQSAGVHMDQMFDGKMRPDQAGYRPSTPGGPRCDQCANFIPPDQCAVVAGKISPDGVSDQFVDEHAGATGQGDQQALADGGPPPPAPPPGGPY